MDWSDRPILCTVSRCDIQESRFRSDIKAHRIGDNWFAEVLPGYDVDEAGMKIDSALTEMITAPFDPTVPYASSDECFDVTEARFRAAVRLLDEMN